MVNQEYHDYVRVWNISVYQYLFKNLLEPKKIPDSQLARAIGVSPQTVGTWHNGVCQPSEETAKSIIQFASTLGITLMIECLHKNIVIRRREFEFEIATREPVTITMRGHPVSQVN